MFDVRVAAVPTYLMSATLDAVKLQLRILYRHAQLSLTELGLDDDLQTVRQLYSALRGYLCYRTYFFGKNYHFKFRTSHA